MRRNAHSDCLTLSAFTNTSSGVLLLRILYFFAIACGFPLAIFPTFTIVESKLFNDGPSTYRRKWLKNLSRTFLTFLMGILDWFCSLLCISLGFTEKSVGQFLLKS